jgi:tetratricopeptide (TPR) repeat protein
MKALFLMKARRVLLNPAVAVLLAFAVPAQADDAVLDSLFQQLQTVDEQGAEAITQQIYAEWAKSGSPSMDLLLMRGHQAMQMGDFDTAIGHFTAIIDHAPEFAEAWNARATAYFNAGDLGPSISDIRHTLALNPRHFGALAGLGMIFEQLNEPEKALEVYQAALAINPHLPSIEEAVTRLSAAKGQEL